MNDDPTRKWEGFQRMHEFGVDNTSDFGAGAPAPTQFNLLGTITANVDTSAAEQDGAAGQIALRTEYKANSREFLRDKISSINTLARAMADTSPGIDDLFRMPRNRNDADLLAAGRAFHTNSDTSGYEDAFTSHGLPTDFRDTLHDACDNFEASLYSLASVLADRAEGTAEIIDWILQDIRARRILDGICCVKFENNPGKLAAWLQSRPHRKSPSKPKTPAP